MKLKNGFLRHDTKKVSLFCLSNFTRITRKAAVKLKRMKIKYLNFSGITEISGDTLKILCSAKTKRLTFTSAILTTSNALILANKFKGRELCLKAMTLNFEVVSALSNIKNNDCWIILDDLTTVSDNCLIELAKIECNLCMRHLPLSDSQYQKLTKSFLGKKLICKKTKA